MSHYTDNQTITLPSKRKNKYPLTKPSFLECSSKIMQNIEKKEKNKSPLIVNSLHSHSKHFDNVNRPIIPLTNIPPTLKGKKAKSTQRLTNHINTMNPSMVSKTPKNNNLSVQKTSNTSQAYTSNVSKNASIYKKRDTSLQNHDDKQLSGSSSFHAQNNFYRARIINKIETPQQRDGNNRLLTSASFTGQKPTLDAFIGFSKIKKNKKEINVKKVPSLTLKKSGEINNHNSKGNYSNTKIKVNNDQFSNIDFNNNNELYNQTENGIQTPNVSLNNPIIKEKRSKNNTPVHIPSSSSASSQSGYNNLNALKNIMNTPINSSSKNTSHIPHTPNPINKRKQDDNHTNHSNKKPKKTETLMGIDISNTKSKQTVARISTESPIRIIQQPNPHHETTPSYIKKEPIIQISDNGKQATQNTTLGTPNILQHAKKVITIDSFTKAGFSSLGVEKNNQDNYFITQHFLNEPEQYLLGVCDGHGSSGHLASEYIVNTLPDKLLELFLYEKPHSDIHSNISEGFTRLHNELIENIGIDTKFSGTTCVSTIIYKEKIICANLGDSRAVLGKYDKGQWSAIDLSRDHKATEVDESTRVLKRGGRIASYIDEITRENIGPQRVWLKEAEIPGLAMTRSFGDQIAHCVGVISEPEIKEYPFQGTEKFIILGSDGLWEFIDSVECVHIIKDYYIKGDVSDACYAIVDEAFNRWIKDQDVVDDITVVIAFLD